MGEEATGEAETAEGVAGEWRELPGLSLPNLLMLVALSFVR